MKRSALQAGTHTPKPWSSMAEAHGFDALVFIPNAIRIVPGW
jgi:hypothetical protein